MRTDQRMQWRKVLSLRRRSIFAEICSTVEHATRDKLNYVATSIRLKKSQTVRPNHYIRNRRGTLGETIKFHDQTVQNLHVIISLLSDLQAACSPSAENCAGELFTNDGGKAGKSTPKRVSQPL